MAKETYLYGKRDLPIWQKRPTYMAKETYLYGKRDLLIWQKIPTSMTKETYVHKKKSEKDLRVVRAHLTGLHSSLPPADKPGDMSPYNIP
jgi:hypothetical protein